MTRLEILLEQIDAQMHVLELQAELDGQSVFTQRDEDGNFPLAPLLLAKAQTLNAIVMLQTRDQK